jgi:hypothetical protein
MIKALPGLLSFTAFDMSPRSRKMGELHTNLTRVSLPVGQQTPRVPHSTTEVPAERIKPRQLSRASGAYELLGMCGIGIAPLPEASSAAL